MIDKLFFMHVPKVAGTSMVDYILKYYPNYDIFPFPFSSYSYPANYKGINFRHFYNDTNYYSPSTIKKDLLNYYVDNTIPFESGLDRFFLHGHLNPLYFFDLKDLEKTKDIFLFTFFRDPLERLKSEYLFFKSSIKKGLSFHDFKYELMKSEEWSFEKYALHPLTLNLQTEMIFYFPIERFNFIGLYENIDKDWNDLCSMIGIPQQKLAKKNVNNHKEELNISENLRSNIIDYHWRDYCLYDRVRRQKQLA